jgi:inhibitor of KinA sporulation pathway (predicted exonuclease)
MYSPQFYLVVDLEATCDDLGTIPRAETEIIEIGAVLCDAATLAPVGEWQSFVRPLRHPRLTPFCTQLTSITQAQVDGAPRFPVVIASLAAWVKGKDLLFCSWGDYDRNQLDRDARRHGVALPLGRRHLNLKQAFRDRSGDDKKLGVGQALGRVGLRFAGTAHRGIDDARNIARLLPFALGRAPIPAVSGPRR